MNRIRDEIRRAHRRPAPAELPDDVPDGATSPLDAASFQEVYERYEAALEQLRDEDREAIIARVELRQSYQQVALVLGKPSPDAARVAVKRALVRLAEKMKT
jgi:RNA polymerase sigma factor (sigma-70 family)